MPAIWKQLAYKEEVLPNLLSPYAVGDLLYASSISALSKLADVAVGQVLVSGGVGAAPAWSASPVLTTSLTVPTIYGSAGASGTLTLASTSHATKGTISIGRLTLSDLANDYGIIFNSLGTATRAIDLSGSGLSGNSDYLIYFDATNWWRCDGVIRLTGSSSLRVTSIQDSQNSVLHITLGGTAADDTWDPTAGQHILIMPTGAGNIGLCGVTAFGTSASKALGMGSGTAPTTFPANMAQMCVKDQVAGNACFHFYTELGQIIKLYQQAALTTALTGITHTAPGTPDYALQNLVQNTGFGFATADEGNSLLAVVANLQTRMGELATILANNGLTA